ncbi:MAG: VanW family protein [Agathobacter rectalis]
MKNSRKMRGLLVMLIAFAFCFLAEPVKADDRTALDGIYVEDISVGGMTEEQITQAVNDKIEQLKPSVINLSAGEQNAQVTAGDLGLSCANPEVAREAVTIGQEGNVLKRFLTQNRLKKGETVTFSLKYTVDGEAARQAVENNTAVLNREATDATLTRENGEFIVNPGQTGCSVNVDESTAKVVNYLTTSWRGGIGGVELVTEETPAGGNPEQLALVKDLLGEGTTEYGNGTSGRKQNVAVGAEKINGTLVQPGEEFSVEAVVVPFDAENGYALAASYEMGKVVDSYGGGICQVSTTLYVAVLKAELEVTERYSHSMIVHYVDPSMDAAIAEGLKDLKFINNTDAPIYIEASADGSTLHLNASFGTIEQTSYGYQGSTARLWKIVNDNGNETKEQVNSSTYRMTSDVYTVGTKTDNAAARAEMQAAIAANDLAKAKEVAAKYSQSSSSSSSSEKKEDSSDDSDSDGTEKTDDSSDTEKTEDDED